MKRSRRRRPLALFGALIGIFAMLGTLTGCVAVKSPPLEEVYDRAVTLIEASGEINEIFFGKGLPAQDFEADYQALVEGGTVSVSYEEYLRLFDTNEFYKPVTSDRYVTVEDIKRAAEQVYSADYLSQIYVSAFEGMVSDNGTISARYWEGPEGLMILKEADVWVTSSRIFDYATMQMGRSDKKDHFYVEIMSRTEDSSEWQSLRLGFVLQDGEWFLDTPTY